MSDPGRPPAVRNPAAPGPSPRPKPEAFGDPLNEPLWFGKTSDADIVA